MFSEVTVNSRSHMGAEFLSNRIAKHLPLYREQFSKPQYKNGLTQDGYSDFFNFSTGRKNIASLHTVFALRPRHDLFQYLFQVARTLVDLNYRPVDDLQLDFKLAPGVLPDGFVFAVVTKDELPTVKDGRWDLVCPYSSIFVFISQNECDLDVHQDL